MYKGFSLLKYCDKTSDACHLMCHLIEEAIDENKEFNDLETNEQLAILGWFVKCYPDAGDFFTSRDAKFSILEMGNCFTQLDDVEHALTIRHRVKIDCLKYFNTHIEDIFEEIKLKKIANNSLTNAA